MMPIKVVIADDHALFRDGLRRILSLEKGILVVATVMMPWALAGHAPMSIASSGSMKKGMGSTSGLLSKISSRILLISLASVDELQAVPVGRA